MEREWENGERERKWREIEEIERERENGERFSHFPSILSSSLHYLIFSTFPLHFLILSPFSHSLAILFGEEIKERTSNWRGNGERMRKWREREKMERDWGNRKRERKWREIFSFSLHSLFLSPLSHFLYISSPFSLSLSISSISVHFQNWPVLVCADLLLKRAMDKFFKDKNPRGDGRWHMYHSDETRFYPQNESRAMRRLQKEKSKLSFDA